MKDPVIQVDEAEKCEQCGNTYFRFPNHKYYQCCKCDKKIWYPQCVIEAGKLIGNDLDAILECGRKRIKEQNERKFIEWLMYPEKQKVEDSENE